MLDARVLTQLLPLSVVGHECSFLEHMLFLGTEKYPVENTYKEMVSR